MSEITPNTPNPVREDAYVEELAEKLGIDPQYIPKSPVWRNEEEIKAIAEMFSNMSGGSSGGGVLVVNGTPSGNEIVLDKTCKEIWDAMKSGGVVIDAVSLLYPVVQASKNTNEYSFYTHDGMIFKGSGDNEYPEWSDK